jgi:glucokinase
MSTGSPPPKGRHKGFFGIEIGGTKLQIVVGNESLTIVERRRSTVDRALAANGIRQQIESAVSDLMTEFDPIAVGAGFGGPLDRKTGRVCCSHHVAGWSDFELGEWLRGLLGAPVVVENDANIAALAEALRGAGIERNPVFYVTLGSGVGGGLVVDRRIFHGAKPGEAEIGHVRLDRGGAIVEQRCSGWSVDKRIREMSQRKPDSILSRSLGKVPGGEAKHLGRALQHDDAVAGQILHEVTEDLAFALSHVAHLIHPEVIILGGGLSLIGEPLRAAVAGHLPRFTMEAFHPVPEVRLAALGEDAVPIGCLLAARQLMKS